MWGGCSLILLGLLLQLPAPHAGQAGGAGADPRAAQPACVPGPSTTPWPAAPSPMPQTGAAITETPAGADTPTGLSEDGTSPAVEGATATDEPGCGSGQPCPPWSTCVFWAGRFSCRCALGFYLNLAVGCVPAKMFLGRLSLRDPGSAPPRPVPSAEPHRIHLESLFQRILGSLPAYVASSVLDLQPPGPSVTVLHSFSALSPVTGRQVDGAIAAFRARCQASDPACSFLRDGVSYQSLSLCELQPCDPVSATCSFQDGLARCPCRPGYRPAPAMGRACTACGSGFRLLDGVCARCPFGFGGFQCEEPFLLALVGVSCIGCLLLLLTVLLLLGRARALAQPPSLAEPVVLPFRPQQLSLPRVQPPRAGDMPELGTGDRAHPFPEDRPSLGVGWGPGAGPTLKTFRGSQSSPASAPRPAGSWSNVVLVSAEEWGRRNYF